MNTRNVNSIPEALLTCAKEMPEKLCIADAAGELTYREMAHLTLRLRDCFLAMGIGEGKAQAADPVGLGNHRDAADPACTGNRKAAADPAAGSENRKAAADRNACETDYIVVECMQRAMFLAVEFAAQLCGAVFVPLEARCSFGKMTDIVRMCDAKLLIVNRTPDAQQKDECPCPVMTYAALETAAGEMTKRTAEKRALAGAAAVPAAQAGGAEALDFPSADTVSEILFSTGTTGKEKGIVLTHRNNIALAENVAYGNDLAQDNVELIPSPLNHSHGLRSAYANLLFGASIVLVDNVFDMKRFFGAIERYGVTSIDLVPAALTMILNLTKDKLGDYRARLRYIEFGSAPLRTADKEKLKTLLPDTAMNNFYGSTESGRSTVYNFNVKNEKQGCIGKPTRNAVITIVDENRQAIVSDAQHTGRLASGGAMNMTGYFRDPKETADAMEHGIVYTKDEAYFDADGDIMLLGRADDVINIGGRKVSPEELENIVRRMPQVADCACIGVDDAMSGKVPKLFVQMKENEIFDAKEIRDYIRQQTEAYKMPKYIEQIDRIPRTYNGKLLRRALLTDESGRQDAAQM